MTTSHSSLLTKKLAPPRFHFTGGHFLHNLRSLISIKNLPECTLNHVKKDIHNHQFSFLTWAVLFGGVSYLTANPQIIYKINADGLSTVSKTGIGKGLSVFFLMSLEREGIEILHNYPELCEKISAEALNSPFRLYGESSPLWHLCKCEEGRKLLFKHPHLVAMINEETLNKVPNESPIIGGIDNAECKEEGIITFLRVKKIYPENKSAAAYLLTSETGHKILAKHPNVRNMIQKTTLNALGEDGLILASNLCNSDAGIEILYDLELLTKIDLTEFNRVDASNRKLPFLQLASCPKGRELLDKRPIICNYISPSVANVTVQDSKFNNNSIMTYLVLNCVNLLLHHEKLASCISEKTLKHVVVKETNISIAIIVGNSSKYKPLFEKYNELLEIIKLELAKQAITNHTPSLEPMVKVVETQSTAVSASSIFQPVQLRRPKSLNLLRTLCPIM